MLKIVHTNFYEIMNNQNKKNFFFILKCYNNKFFKIKKK